MAMNKLRFALVIVLLLMTAPSFAKVDLVTLPNRDYVQVTIYNSEDLTFVRERRILTLREGVNKIEFSWANTLIDPSSIEFKAIEQADKVEAIDTIFPADVSSALVWTIQAEVSGPVLCEISYFTSGLSWNADYMLVSDSLETNADMDVYVKVMNNSGEDYPNAEVRLVVGKVHLVEAIATLARKMELRNKIQNAEENMPRPSVMAKGRMADESGAYPSEELRVEKAVAKEGLSEYFLYTVEGKEDLADKWSKRMRSLAVPNIPIKSLFKFDIPNSNINPSRYYTFRNVEENQLGKEPLPDGIVRVFKRSVDGQNLSFVGACPTKYIPIGQTCEVSLGLDREVTVKPKWMGFAEMNHVMDNYGSINGYDQVNDWKIEIVNYKDTPVKLEIKHRQDSGDYSLKTEEKYEKYDSQTAKFTVELDKNAKKDLVYSITRYFGERVNNR
jgi:hypothetical protein